MKQEREGRKDAFSCRQKGSPFGDERGQICLFEAGSIAGEDFKKSLS